MLGCAPTCMLALTTDVCALCICCLRQENVIVPLINMVLVLVFSVVVFFSSTEPTKQLRYSFPLLHTQMGSLTEAAFSNVKRFHVCDRKKWSAAGGSCWVARILVVGDLAGQTTSGFTAWSFRRTGSRSYRPFVSVLGSAKQHLQTLKTSESPITCAQIEPRLHLVGSISPPSFTTAAFAVKWLLVGQMTRLPSAELRPLQAQHRATPSAGPAKSYALLQAHLAFYGNGRCSPNPFAPYVQVWAAWLSEQSLMESASVRSPRALEVISFGWAFDQRWRLRLPWPFL